MHPFFTTRTAFVYSKPLDFLYFWGSEKEHMEIIEEPLPGVKLLKPKVFHDDRGYFYESYNKATFKKIGIAVDFVQDNESLSQKGVVRGLHFQYGEFAQAKLVSVAKGAVLDVVADIRKNSPTYGKYYAVELNDENKYRLFIPEGFAHGFATLKNNTLFTYKCSAFYNPKHEGGIMFNDPDLNVDWPFNNPEISPKDKNLQRFNGFKSPFE